MIRVAGMVGDSITDGPGIRFTLFTQGCPHNCEGCQNKETHSFEGGTLMSADEIFALIAKGRLTSGVTFSGGEPICQAEALVPLAEKIVASKKELAIYTGYTYEQLLAMDNQYVRKLLSLADTLIDGKFILAERSLALPFRGSRNQRIIDLKASSGSVVLNTTERWNPITH